MSENAVQAVVDPRIERSRRVVREAALQELAESGYGGLTIEAVATRAGVGRSTVYRHWGNKLDLIADALETLNEQPAPDLVDGTPADRVEQMLHHLTDVLAESPFAACVPALVEAAHRDARVRGFLHEYSTRRRRTLTKAIKAGVESGQFASTTDPDLAAQALSGAVFYRRLLTGASTDARQIRGLMQTVLGVPRHGSRIT